MKNFKWITGVSILLFLVASATPAFSKKPWPDGGEVGVDPVVVGKCIINEEDKSVASVYDAVKDSIEFDLIYKVHKRDRSCVSADRGCYELPKAYTPDYTIYREQASLAWSDHHGKVAFSKDDIEDALAIAEMNRDNFIQENYYVCTQDDVDASVPGCGAVGDLLLLDEESRTFDQNSEDQIDGVLSTYSNLVSCIEQQ